MYLLGKILHIYSTERHPAKFSLPCAVMDMQGDGLPITELLVTKTCRIYPRTVLYTQSNHEVLRTIII